VKTRSSFSRSTLHSSRYDAQLLLAADDAGGLENWSLWLDFKILLRTAFRAVSDKTAY